MDRHIDLETFDSEKSFGHASYMHWNDPVLDWAQTMRQMTVFSGRGW